MAVQLGSPLGSPPSSPLASPKPPTVQCPTNLGTNLVAWFAEVCSRSPLSSPLHHRRLLLNVDRLAIVLDIN